MKTTITTLWVFSVFALFPAYAQQQSAINVEKTFIDQNLCIATNSVFDLAGFELLDPTMIADLPDADLVRATSALEATFTSKLIREEIIGPLIKAYCQIGVRRMVVDFIHPVEDDTISYIIVRAIYHWSSVDNLDGWQIFKWGQKTVCARGRERKTSLCI